MPTSAQEYLARLTRPVRESSLLNGVSHLYAAVCGNSVKLGYTKNLVSRYCGLQLACPDRILFLIVGPGGCSHEDRLHKRFDRYRKHGEWFHCKGWLLLFLIKLIISNRKRKIVIKLREGPTQNQQANKLKSHKPTARRLSKLDKFKRKWLPKMIELRNNGDSYSRIMLEISVLSGRLVSDTTIQKWIEMVQ